MEQIRESRDRPTQNTNLVLKNPVIQNIKDDLNK